MKTTGIILIAAMCGWLLSCLITTVGWNVQIERRVLHCTDDIWPYAMFITDLASHREAGDTLSPGWTWDDITRVQKGYRIAFYGLWGFTAAMVWVALSRPKRIKVPNPPPDGTRETAPISGTLDTLGQ